VARSFSAAHIAGSSRTEVWIREADFGSSAGGLSSTGATVTTVSGAGLAFLSAPNDGLGP
jgi:hypothetical protein